MVARNQPMSSAEAVCILSLVLSFQPPDLFLNEIIIIMTTVHCINPTKYLLRHIYEKFTFLTSQIFHN